jgi:type VI secretion system secreted protein Hcp
MAVDMFIKIGDIKGESADSKHKDEIDVLAWSWGCLVGSAFRGGGSSGKVNVRMYPLPSMLTNRSDLMLHCCNGKHIPECTLVVRRPVKTGWYIRSS